MRALVVGTLALVAASCLSVSSVAASEMRADQAIPFAVDWLRQNSRYTEIPDVKFWIGLDDRGMAAQAVKFNAAGDHRKVIAMYSCSNPLQTMFIRSDVDYNNPWYFSVVVHELTHHAQCADHQRIGNCETEREAYTLQAKFLRWTPGFLRENGQGVTDQQAAFLERAAAEVDKIVEQACSALRNR